VRASLRGAAEALKEAEAEGAGSKARPAEASGALRSSGAASIRHSSATLKEVIPSGRESWVSSSGRLQEEPTS